MLAVSKLLSDGHQVSKLAYCHPPSFEVLLPPCVISKLTKLPLLLLLPPANHCITHTAVLHQQLPAADMA